MFKILLFVILLVLINRSTDLLLPDGWENESYAMKREDFLKNYAHNCNAVFFGSSRTYAQIDPVLFDSLNTLAGIHTNSYMLASGSVFFNESLAHVHELFRSDPELTKIKYMFFELDDLVTLSETNLYTPRASYYVTPWSLMPFLRRVSAAGLPLQRAITQYFYFASTCIVTLAQSGYGRAKIEYKLIHLKAGSADWAELKGHRGLNHEVRQYQVDGFKARHEELMRDTFQIQRLFERIDEAERVSTQGNCYNDEVLKACLQLIPEFRAKGIYVIFLLPLRSIMGGSLKSLFHALPDQHKLDLSEIAVNIPALHTTGYWFDSGHLNVKGVRLYTTAFAEEVQRCGDTWGMQSEESRKDIH